LDGPDPTDHAPESAPESTGLPASGWDPEPLPVPLPEPLPVPLPEPLPVPLPELLPVPLAVPLPLPDPLAVPEPLPVPLAVPEPLPDPLSLPEPLPVPLPDPLAVMDASPGDVDASGLPPLELVELPQAGARRARGAATSKTLIPMDAISEPPVEAYPIAADAVSDHLVRTRCAGRPSSR